VSRVIRVIRGARSPSAQDAGEYVIRVLRELDAEIKAAAPRVIASSDDEALHDLRVAIRRLRTMLKVARPVFGRFPADTVRAAFATVMKATGELRDEEVLYQTLIAVCRTGRDETWQRARRARERKLRSSVVATLQSGELDRALVLLEALLAFPIHPKRAQRASKLAGRTVAKAARKVREHLDASPDAPEALHELRIAYKELRYAIELLADALPVERAARDEAQRALAAARQKRLGEIHDLDLAIAFLVHSRAGAAPPRTTTLAALGARREAKVLRLMSDLAREAKTKTKAERPPRHKIHALPGHHDPAKPAPSGGRIAATVHLRMKQSRRDETPAGVSAACSAADRVPRTESRGPRFAAEHPEEIGNAPAVAQGSSPSSPSAGLPPPARPKRASKPRP
jgi:CHAD domain-containing protein